MLPFVNGLKAPNISSIFFLHLEWMYIYIHIYVYMVTRPMIYLEAFYVGITMVLCVCVCANSVYIYIYMCINIYIYIYHTVPVASGWELGSRPSEILLSQGDRVHIFHVDEDLVTQSFYGEIPSLCSYWMLVIWMFLLGICLCNLFVAFHLCGRFFTICPMSSWTKMAKDQRKKRRNHLDRTILTGHLGPFPLVDKCLGSEKDNWGLASPKAMAHLGCRHLRRRPQWLFHQAGPPQMRSVHPTFQQPRGRWSVVSCQYHPGNLSIHFSPQKKTHPGEKKAFCILNKDFRLVKSDYNSFNFTQNVAWPSGEPMVIAQNTILRFKHPYK